MYVCATYQPLDSASGIMKDVAIFTNKSIAILSLGIVC